jgi:hypothetical protein
VPNELEIELFCEPCIPLIDEFSESTLRYELAPSIENLEKIIEAA